MTAIVWFRNDLRIADNPALYEACENHQTVILAYFKNPKADDSSEGAASQWWRHHSISRLQSSLSEHNQRLILKHNEPLDGLLDLIETSQADTIYFNRSTEPNQRALDTRIGNALKAAGIHVVEKNGQLLHTPENILNGQQKPYKVFSAFYKRCRAACEPISPPLPIPNKLGRSMSQLATDKLSDMNWLSPIPWADKFKQYWTPGERGGQIRLEDFVAQDLADYAIARDYPYRNQVSRLSPYLHFGEISPRQIICAIDQAANLGDVSFEAADHFRREIYWREFANDVLWHFPFSTEQPLNENYNSFPWLQDLDVVTKWQRGETGVPLIDAGMRELWQTGFMHNRVRMITASFFTKNLGQHWHLGARWFWDTLVDADLANNVFNWQWAAGCGADAAPYFRIFNPITQGEKFDPDGRYVARWIPELANMPKRWIHRPFEAPKDVLIQANVSLGDNYPNPIVDVKASRQAALDNYQAFKEARLMFAS